MASRRILKIEKRRAHLEGGLHVLLSFIKDHLLLLALVGLIIAGCGTAGSAREGGPLPPSPSEAEDATALSEEFINTLNETRSELDDVFANNNDVPDFFLQPAVNGNHENIGNPYTGYRVQIISTRDITAADSVAAAFRFWADRHIIGYFPQTYVIFDQPYFKVHIGNFQFYQQAVEFTQLVKTKYPGAWVVHDRIKPDAVPTQPIRLVEDG